MPSLAQQDGLTATGRCVHCQLPIPPLRSGEFCCAGCEVVHRTLTTLGLTNFYQLRDATPNVVLQPASSRLSSYQYVDTSPEWQTLIQVSAPNAAMATLRVHGIHCAGCVWLLEKLPQIVAGVEHSAVNAHAGELRVSFNPERCKLSAIAAALDSLGYAPLLPNDSVEERRRDRVLLFRLGVAALAAGNAMGFAVPLYAGEFTGIQQGYSEMFRWLGFAVTLPSVTFSAMPFYENAWRALRLRTSHIDIPIAIGVLIAFSYSTWATFTGRPHIYFDSVTALIFLLLGGRWLQLMALRRAQRASSSAFELIPSVVRRLHGSQSESCRVEELLIGDTVVVGAHERIPADGRVIDGASALDRSVLSGESTPVAVTNGSAVEAGTLNLEATLTIQVERVGPLTTIGTIIARVRGGTAARPRILALTDRFSRAFVPVVLSIATVAFLAWLPHGLDDAIHVAVAILLVTCPCAVGLAVPTALSVAIGRAARSGILVRSAEALERIEEARSVCFDKTGTLTRGELSVVRLHHYDLDSPKTSAILLTLAQMVPSHPASRAVRRWLPTGTAPAPLQDLQHVPGRGVEGRDANGQQWRLGAAGWSAPLPPAEGEAYESAGLSPLILACEGAPKLLLGLRDEAQPTAAAFLTMLSNSGRDLFVLSGDTPAVVRAIAAPLGVRPENCFAALSPEEKAEAIDRISASTLFIGDGVNDARAMQQATVSIAMRGGIEAALAVADVYVPSGDLRQVHQTILGAERVMRTVRTCLRFAFAYNLIGGTLACTGFMSPLVAALLMPLSSLTVVSLATLRKSFTDEHDGTAISPLPALPVLGRAT